ncbi:hypothetical protein L1987_13995 [Smallanthus sonchifolius]|uniref:Uncharacterized protein n=1 Tax=Smallanthus sonchifolius TaxID=185202 RepID=A0ACB9JLJ7_9ASTR|nr:hypothetical protein L1987_13995 [Smallanthus sonchifolius]
MAETRKEQIESHIKSWLKPLKELPTNRGEDLQSKGLLVLYGLKLAELQNKMRLNARSEYMLQRNAGVQAWHGRQRRCATGQEKLRFQALKLDDQEAYMKMVEENKHKHLKILLGKTNVLVRLGAAVRRQKRC